MINPFFNSFFFLYIYLIFFKNEKFQFIKENIFNRFHMFFSLFNFIIDFLTESFFN
jgi:hypothetical protein